MTQSNYRKLLTQLNLLAPKGKSNWKRQFVQYLYLYREKVSQLTPFEVKAIDSLAHYYRHRPQMDKLHKCSDACQTYCEDKVKVKVVSPLLFDKPLEGHLPDWGESTKVELV